MIKTFCKQTGQSAGLTSYDLQNLVVNKSLKIIYCVTPKCASRQLRNMVFPARFEGGGMSKILHAVLKARARHDAEDIFHGQVHICP